MIISMLLSLLSGAQAQSAAAKCGQAKGDGQINKQAKTESVETLGVEAFASRMVSKDVALVDVRSPKEFAEGHLKGAVNVAWGNDFETLWKAAGIEKRHVVAVYCRGGRRSRAAAAALAKQGYRVVELEGGVMAWKKAGKPLYK